MPLGEKMKPMFAAFSFYILLTLVLSCPAPVSAAGDDMPKEAVGATEDDTPKEAAGDGKSEKKRLAAAEKERINKIFNSIYEKAKTVKRSPSWLRESYNGIKARRLNDLQKEDYKTFRQYLSGEDVYFIVHPGFYVFFENQQKVQDGEMVDGFPVNNLFDRFIDISDRRDKTIRLLREQEQLTVDFFEFISTEKKLVVLVLPKDYKKTAIPNAVSPRDEYSRYINDITNMSESTLYIESITHDNGGLTDADIAMVSDFLNEIGAKRIFIGGGYLGKCLDDFYNSMRKRYSRDSVFIVPELSSISPSDIGPDALKFYIKGKINFSALKKYARLTGATEEPPKFKSLPLYRPYR